MLPQRSLKQLRRAHGGLSRLLQGPIASQEQGGSPSHTPYSKALENLSGPQPSIWASNILFRNTYAERGGLSRVVRGPTALKKQGGSRTSLPTRKHGRPFRSKKPPLMLSNTSEKQLNGARRAVTRCARTHRPQTSREGRNLPLLASLENLSGLQPSFQASFVFSQCPMHSVEGCHALCEDPPPQTSKMGRHLPCLPTSVEAFQVLSPPLMLPDGSEKQLCRASRAVTRCAKTHRLKQARRIALSHAYPQAWKTFRSSTLM